MRHCVNFSVHFHVQLSNAFSQNFQSVMLEESSAVEIELTEEQLQL